MNSHWAKVCEDENERESLKKYLENSNFLLDKLTKICYNIMEDSERVSKKNYNSPGWAYEQAHRNGEVDSIKKILEIIGRT